MSSELAKQLLWLAGLRSETDDKETLEMIDSVTFSCSIQMSMAQH